MMADKASKKWNELLAFGIITLLDHRWVWKRFPLSLSQVKIQAVNKLSRRGKSKLRKIGDIYVRKK